MADKNREVNIIQRENTMRNRKILSCLNCYKRKVKCDKKKPLCTACEKNRIPAHLCVYKESPVALQAWDEKRMQDEIVSLKKENEILRGKSHANSNTNERYDLSGYFRFKNGAETVKFNGASSPNAIFYHSFGDLSVVSQLIQVVRDSYYSWAPMRQFVASQNTSITGCLDRVSQLVTTFKDMSFALTQYLQNANTLSCCIDETKLFQYFCSVFDSLRVDDKGNVQIKKNISLDKLCLVLCIILENSIQENDGKYIQNQELFTILRYLLLNSGLEASFPTLYAYICMYQLEKYYFDNDLCNNYRKTDLLPAIIHLSITMGLHNDIDRQFRDEPLDFRKCLKNIWSYIVFEDSINSVQKGFPSLIHDGYFDKSLIFQEDINARDMTVLFREIGINVNLNQLSRSVDLNRYLERLETLKDHQTNHGGDFIERNKLSVLCFSQTLSHLRFLAAPSSRNKILAANHTLNLYNVVKGMAFKFQTTSPFFSPLNEFHDVKVALFRCLYFFVHLYMGHESPEEADNSKTYDLDKNTNELVHDREKLASFLKTDLFKSMEVVGKYNLRALLLKSFLITVVDSVTTPNDLSHAQVVPSSQLFSLEGFAGMEELESIFFT